MKLILLISIFIISSLAFGTDKIVPKKRMTQKFKTSNEELQKLNLERLEHKMETIADETFVDEIIQNELDSILDDKVNAFKKNKSTLKYQLPNMEAWASRNKMRAQARGASFHNKIEDIIIENPKRKNEAIEFYKKNCNYECPKLDIKK